MSQQRVLFTLFGLIAVVLLHAEGAEQCQGMDMKEYEQDKMWMAECAKEVGAETPMEAMMMPCFRKCLMVKRGIVDDLGNPNREKAMELMRMTAPDALVDELSKMAGECVDMHAAKVKEEKMSCESYVPTCQCLYDAFMNTCFKR